METFIQKLQLPKNRLVLKYILGVVICILAYFIFLAPPSSFPFGKIVSIDTGETLQSISTILNKEGVIKSPLAFRVAVILLGGEKRVIAGDYKLPFRQSPITLAYRLVHGDFQVDVKKVTIPEGWTSIQIGSLLQKTLLNFDKKKFLTLAKEQEGYLFPDTYFILQTARPEQVVKVMRDNFDVKVLGQRQVLASGRPLADVITMASIVELEALHPESKRLIAGVLWHRIEVGMPLQVDAAFLYINGKSTYKLTLADLRIDSPYNTYRYKGLPKGPIGNPGLDTIIATADPIKTDYLYFVSDKNNIMHYAKTLAEHNRNVAKYLR